jgi:hypothetical protein
LKFLRLIHDSCRQTPKPLFERTVEKQIREDGHRNNWQEADRHEIDQQPCLYLGSKLTLSALATQLDQIADEDKGEDYEGDKIERRESVKQQRVGRSIEGNNGPQPQLLRYDNRKQHKQDHAQGPQGDAPTPSCLIQDWICRLRYRIFLAFAHEELSRILSYGVKRCSQSNSTQGRVVQSSSF